MTVDRFSEFLFNISSKPLQVLNIPSVSNYVLLDLSDNNPDLQGLDISSSEALSQYIKKFTEINNATVAWGGYKEKRNIYRRSLHFNDNIIINERNIHLGIDLWSDAGTEILTPLSGKVHSFKNNNNYGDYGPTIILEHLIDGIKFYMLYGHLSLESIQNLKEGQVFLKGDKIGTLGDSNINGDYPPHLHFQIIINLQNYIGDYPGVCSVKDLNFYSKNCPDPNLLLKIDY